MENTLVQRAYERDGKISGKNSLVILLEFGWGQNDIPVNDSGNVDEGMGLRDVLEVQPTGLGDQWDVGRIWGE